MPIVLPPSSDGTVIRHLRPTRKPAGGDLPDVSRLDSCWASGSVGAPGRDVISENVEFYSFDQFAGVAAFDSMVVPGTGTEAPTSVGWVRSGLASGSVGASVGYRPATKP